MSTHLTNDLTFANLANGTFPLTGPGNVQAAWNYINDPQNTINENKDTVEEIKERLRAASRQSGVEHVDENHKR